jgi:peptidyl-prolyl cis-trans isomerase A (cyclophilin A)
MTSMPSPVHLRSIAALSLVGSACGPALAPGEPGPVPPEIPDLVAANAALGDPHHGRFPFEAAVEGLPETGALLARLRTSEGDVECRLEPDHAPLTVASFVGLARGRRPFLGDDGRWHTEPFYVDLPWHRAIEGQFVQTGRRGRQETGGFLLQDEVSPGDSFARGGVLAMANAGIEHSGSTQFFITTGAARHLEGAHTIFGQCDSEAVVRRLERRAAAGDPPRLVEIEVTRRPRAPAGGRPADSMSTRLQPISRGP